jgi:uncharacterized protein YukE
MSNQVIADPEQLRSFARHLGTFNGQLTDLMTGLRSGLSSLGESWRDTHYESFKDSFDQTVTVLNRFLNDSERYVQYLNQVVGVTCPYCGKALLPGASYCWACARVLVSGGKPTAGQQPEQAAFSGWKVVLVLAIAFLITVGGLSGYWYLVRSPDSRSPDQRARIATQPMTQIPTANSSPSNSVAEPAKPPDSAPPSEVTESKTAKTPQAAQQQIEGPGKSGKEAEAQPGSGAAAAVADGFTRDNPATKPAEDTPKNPTTPPAQSVSPATIENRYSGPKSGVLVWSGQMNKDESIAIEGAGATKGSPHGDFLSGVPVKIEIQPQSIVVAEHPSAFNGYKRIVIRSKVRRNTVVLIRWAISLR